MTPRPTDSRRLSNFAIGVIALVLTVVGFYLAFSKSIPFTGDGYTVKAVFQSASVVRNASSIISDRRNPGVRDTAMAPWARSSCPCENASRLTENLTRS